MNVTGLQLAITFTALFVPPYVESIRFQAVCYKETIRWMESLIYAPSLTLKVPIPQNGQSVSSSAICRRVVWPFCEIGA